MILLWIHFHYYSAVEVSVSVESWDTNCLSLCWIRSCHYRWCYKKFIKRDIIDRIQILYMLINFPVIYILLHLWRLPWRFLYIFICTLYNVQCIFCMVQCIQYILQCNLKCIRSRYGIVHYIIIVHILQCTICILNKLQCIHYIIQYIHYIVQCILNSVDFT